MKSQNIQFRVLTNAELSALKGAGTDPGYVGPPIESGSDKNRDRNFFSTLMSFFTFDIGSFFSDED